jgi:glutamyl-tRNA reductase
VYFSAEDLAEAHSALLHVLREEIPFPFEHKLYAYFGSDCFEHLAQVTAGLDSMVIAESEIQGQVKQAYEQTCLHYALPSAMHYLFQKSLRLGKHLRSQSVFPRGHITIPRMVYDLWSHLSSDIKTKKVLFIGNSEINRKVLKFFKYKGIDRLSLCTRSVLSARDMSIEPQLEILDWTQLSSWEDYDAVVSGTNASSFLIRDVKEGVKTQVIFDLGVPRNVDPRLSRNPHISLFNIDELGLMLEKRQAAHTAGIKESEAIIQEKVHAYMHAFQEKRSSVHALIMQEVT